MGCKLHILLAGDDMELFTQCDKHMVIISVGSICCIGNIHVSVKYLNNDIIIVTNKIMDVRLAKTVGLIWQPFKHVKNANIVPHNYDD